MSPKCIQVGAVWKASSSLFALWIPASAREWQGAKGMKAGEDQSMLRRTGEPRPKSASSARPWLLRCPRAGLSIGACRPRCRAPRAQGRWICPPEETPFSPFLVGVNHPSPSSPMKRNKPQPVIHAVVLGRMDFRLRNKCSSVLTLGK